MTVFSRWSWYEGGVIEGFKKGIVSLSNRNKREIILLASFWEKEVLWASW
jgi:hypothetical protein